MLESLSPGATRQIELPIIVSPKNSKGDTVETSINAKLNRGEVVQKLSVKADLPSTPVDPSLFAYSASSFKSSNQISVLTRNIPQGQSLGNNSYALIIANQNYQNNVSDVDVALSDARAVAKYAEKTLGYERVSNPTNLDLNEFRRIFGDENNNYEGRLYKQIKQRAERDPEQQVPVFIYYSGHGVPDPNNQSVGYIAPVDLRINEVKRTGYSFDELNRSLSRLPTKNITVVLDACFSGYAGSGKPIAQNMKPALLRRNKTSPSIASSERITYFNSSSPNQVSYWLEGEEYSVFTYYFLSALKGAADGDEDKQITIGELYDYVTLKVNDYTLDTFDAEQNPQINQRNNSKILVKLQ
jgi:hypothetical protein